MHLHADDFGHFINKALAALVATVRESLEHPGFQERVEATFQKLWAEHERDASRSDEGERLSREIGAVEAKIARLMRLVEDGNGDVEALIASETQARELRGRRAAEGSQPAAGRRMDCPDVGQLWRSVLEDVPRVLMATPPGRGRCSRPASSPWC